MTCTGRGSEIVIVKNCSGAVFPRTVWPPVVVPDTLDPQVIGVALARATDNAVTGAAVGEAVVGTAVGADVGAAVGAVGARDGTAVGSLDGRDVGDAVGAADGESVKHVVVNKKWPCRASKPSTTTT